MAQNIVFAPIKKWTFTLDQGACTANTTTNSSAQTAKGAETTGWFLVKRPPTLDAGLIVEAICTTAGQILLRFHNVTVGDINPASLVYEVIMIGR